MSRAKTLQAVFDGTVLRPEGTVDLEMGKRYILSIKKLTGEEKKKELDYPLTQILDIAADMGVDDLSIRHAWYAHMGLDEEEITK